MPRLLWFAILAAVTALGGAVLAGWHLGDGQPFFGVLWAVFSAWFVFMFAANMRVIRRAG
jgi:hypothetical protein